MILQTYDSECSNRSAGARKPVTYRALLAVGVSSHLMFFCVLTGFFLAKLLSPG